MSHKSTHPATTTSQGGELKPKRKLKTWEITAISIGFMGPVMAMSLNGIGVAGLVGKAVPFTFAVAFVGTLLVAYSFIRLTGLITHAGSVYALAGSTIGPRVGFFGGFALLGTYIFFAACIVGACAVFFEAFWNELGLKLEGAQWMLILILVLVLGLALNLRESKITARTLLVIGFIGIAAMLVLAGVIIATVGSGNAPVKTGIDLTALSPGETSWTAIITASVFAFLSWAGFESGSSLGEEAENPKRVVPRSLLLAVTLGGCTYVLIMFAQTIGFGTDETGVSAFQNASSTLTELSTTYIGKWFAIGISAIAFCVALAAFLSSTAAASRLLFALARDDFGPKQLAKTNPKTGVPSNAVWFAVVLAVVMAFVLGVFGATSVDVYYWYATIGTLCMVIAYGMTSVGAISYALKPESQIKKYELILPTLAVLYLVLVYVNQVIGQVAPYTYFPYIAGAWCLIGLIIALARPNLAKKIGTDFTKNDPL